MSFGIGAGDILKVGDLAYKVWKACSSASSEFRELNRELSSIQITLRSLADDVNDPASIICRRGVARKDELMVIVGNLELALVEVDRLVVKYQSLGLTKKRTFDRAKFATHDLNDIRQKLTVHLSALNSFYNSLSTNSLARIEAILEDLYQDIRNGDREPTVISMCNDPKDEPAWSLLEKELASEGIEIAEVNKYRSDIVAFLRTLILRDPEGIDPSDSVSNDPASHRLAMSDLLCLEKLRVQDFHVDTANPEEDDRESALRWAAGNGHLELVLYLIRNNVDVNAHATDGSTALHESSKNGHLDIVKALIEADANIHALRTEQAITPTKQAIIPDPKRPYRTFNFNHCKVSVRTAIFSPLMEAARQGKTSIVQYLIEHGASLVGSEPGHATPLHWAITNNHMSVSRTLIEAGSNLEATSLDHDSYTPLFVAASQGNLSLLKMLLKHGADPLKSYAYQGSILNVTLNSRIKEQAKLAICKTLIDAGVRVSPARIQKAKSAPLNIAILNREDKIVDFLLTRGADPDFIDDSGRTPLQHAFSLPSDNSKSFTIIKRLARADADCKWRSSDDNRSYLHIAASEGHVEALKLFLEQGMDVNDLDRFETNSLHFAANAGSVECVKLLLEKGINAKQQSKLKINNYYARDLAILNGNVQIIALLENLSPTTELQPQSLYESEAGEIWTYDRGK